MILFENSYRSFRTKHLQNKKNATEIEEDKYLFDSEVLTKSASSTFSSISGPREAIEEILNFASVTNILQKMKKLLLAICLLLCALMPNFAEPTSSPQSEQIPMGYDKTYPQSGRPRTILPDVTAERSNSIVSVHVKRYTGYVSTYIVDSNGVTVSTSMGYAMDGQYDTNCVMDNIAHDSYTIHVVLDDCSYIGYFEM